MCFSTFMNTERNSTKLENRFKVKDSENNFEVNYDSNLRMIMSENKILY